MTFQFFLSFEVTETEKTGALEKGNRLVFVITAVRLPTDSRKLCFGSWCASPKFQGKKIGRLVGTLGVQPFGSKPITLHGGGGGS